MDIYSFDNLKERAAAAVLALRPYIEEKLAHEQRLRADRKARGLPTLAILGHGRAGKDTTATYLCWCLGLRYDGSSSDRLSMFVAHMTGLTRDEAFKDRHAHRDFWYAAGHAIRENDLTLLARMTLGAGDMCVGLRGRDELLACQERGVVDLSMWIDNSRAAKDPTVDFTYQDCDIMVPNHGTIDELHRKLDRLSRVLARVD